MRFKRNTKPGFTLESINLVALINVIFLVLIIFMFSSSFTTSAGIPVELPRSVTSDIIKEENIVIAISGENVVYYNNKIVSITELAGELKYSANRSRSILIKADRRSSLGRTIDIWNLCRKLGIERVNIATNQDK